MLLTSCVLMPKQHRILNQSDVCSHIVVHTLKNKCTISISGYFINRFIDLYVLGTVLCTEYTNGIVWASYVPECHEILFHVVQSMWNVFLSFTW